MSALAGGLMALLLVLIPMSPVSAQQERANADRIRELEQQLEKIRTELEVLRTEQQRQQQQLAVTPPPREPEPKLPLRIGGSVTFRFDSTEVEDQTDLLQDEDETNGLRARVRLSVDYNVDGAAGAGIRLSTGEDPNPTSPFIVLGNSFRSSDINLDQYYIITRPVKFFESVRQALEPIQDLSLTVGKMPLPFWRGDRGTWRSEIIWDDDISPPGVALKFPIPTGLFFLQLENTFGYFVVNEVSNTRFSGLTDDTYLIANQFKLRADPVTLAFAIYDYQNLNAGLRAPSFDPSSGAFLTTGTSARLIGGGLQTTNNRINFGPGADGFVEEEFTILNFIGQAYLPVPGRWVAPLGLDYLEPWVAGDWVKNTKVDRNDEGSSITVGLRGAPKNRLLGPFNIWFTYRDVDADATLSAFTDSDLGAGTAYNGYEFGVNYKILPDLMLAFSYFDFEGFPKKDNQVRRWFLDLVFTF
jgi:hypothetical protein